MRVVPIQCHKGRVTSGRLHLVVVREFCCQEEFVPIVLLVADKELDELLKLLVDAFSLAISLWVVSSGGRQSYAY